MAAEDAEKLKALLEEYHEEYLNERQRRMKATRRRDDCVKSRTRP